ncbi:hypothetical protein DM558_12390 [Entomomonas moraniae]|uniref:Laminin G domain-containing protein n=2 Tax=Entomomonas moraniae TaxID=2213226 RepID=A0A451EP07_9GAMM|nr:hypothetical protein DM558_12390 [Entomomonas moraniae]
MQNNLSKKVKNTMKLKHYILPFTLAVCANTALSEDYGWYHHPLSLVGPFSSPEELCASEGAGILDMDPVGLISWNGTSAGRCDTPGGLGFFRLGDSCPTGKVYDYKQMSCEPPEPNSKKENCPDSGKDPDGQCYPQNDPKSCPDIAGNPVFIATGQKVEIVTDITLPNSALNFTRNYWSSRLDTDTTGLAWQHNWQMHIKELQSRGRIKLYRDNGRGIIFTPRNGRWESDSKDTEVITKLTNNQGWKVQTATGEIELYNHLGQLISYEKPGVPTVTLIYNANQQLISLKDTKGRSLALTYNAKNLITNVTASNGSTIIYSYDTQNRLISFTKEGNKQTYHYENTKHPQLLTGITDERGIRYATWTYNDNGQAISSEHAGGAEKYTFEYLPNNQTRVTNPLGKSALYTFQDIRLEKKIKKIEGQAINSCTATSQSFNYNAKGLVVSENTKNNATIYYEYNDRGLQTKRKFDGSVLRYESTTKWHNTLPLPIEINNNGQRQSFQYDSNGRLVEYTNGFKDQSEINKGQDVALLQFDDFTDEAGNIWQTIGNPQIVDDAVMGKALYLDGKSYLTTSMDKFQFGTGDFTIEFRAKVKPRVPSSGEAYVFIDMMNMATPDSSISIYATNSSPKGALVYHAYQSASVGMVHGYPNNLNILDDQWHHIAYVRKNNVLTVYYDGVKRLTLNDSINYQFDKESTKLTIGARNVGESSTVEGYIDQVRISKEAIYTENFAPNDERFELNNHEVENYKGKDVALLQFNDFTDETGTKWNKVGNPQIVDDPDTVTGKALYLDGNSYLTTPVDKFQFGKEDFTIEFWFKANTGNVANLFIDMMNTSSQGSSLSIYQAGNSYNGVLVYHAFQSRETGMSHGYPNNLNVGDNKWHHAAFVKKNGVVSIFVDGVKKHTINDNIDYAFYPEDVKLAIGTRNSGKDGYSMKGYLDQIRISKRAIYNENFTPSREPYVLNQGVTNP